MAKTINSYPVLTAKHLSEIEFSNNDLHFYYTDGGVEKKLYKKIENDRFSKKDENEESSNKNGREKKSKRNVFTLSSEDDIWHPERNDTIISLSPVIYNTGCLFDEETGITYRDSVLGLALMWTDPVSMVRGIMPLEADILCSQDDFKHACRMKMQRLVIPPQQIRGILEISLVLYLKKNGALAAMGTKPFCTTVGAILGTLDSSKYIIAGEGSVFPIAEATNPKAPLWEVYWNSWNPEEDEFCSDNVALVLNMKHKLASKYQLDAGLDSPFMKEILCSFFAVLIMQTHEKMKAINDQGIFQSTTYSSGTIAAYVIYLIETEFKVHDCVESGNINELIKKIRMHVFNDESKVEEDNV